MKTFYCEPIPLTADEAEELGRARSRQQADPDNVAWMELLIQNIKEICLVRYRRGQAQYNPYVSRMAIGEDGRVLLFAWQQPNEN
jgi:hypothetical protein